MATIALDAFPVKPGTDVEGTSPDFELAAESSRRPRRERKGRQRKPAPERPPLSGYTPDRYVELLMRLGTVRGKAQAVFHYLFDLAVHFDNFDVWPSENTIEDQTNVAHRTMQTGLAELRQLGVTRHEDRDGLRHIILTIFQGQRPSVWYGGQAPAPAPYQAPLEVFEPARASADDGASKRRQRREQAPTTAPRLREEFREEIKPINVSGACGPGGIDAAVPAGPEKKGGASAPVVAVDGPTLALPPDVPSEPPRIESITPMPDALPEAIADARKYLANPEPMGGGDRNSRYNRLRYDLAWDEVVGFGGVALLPPGCPERSPLDRPPAPAPRVVVRPDPPRPRKPIHSRTVAELADDVARESEPVQRRLLEHALAGMISRKLRNPKSKNRIRQWVCLLGRTPERLLPVTLIEAFDVAFEAAADEGVRQPGAIFEVELQARSPNTQPPRRADSLEAA